MDNKVAKTRASYHSAILVCVIALAAAAAISAARLVPNDWRAPLHSASLPSLAVTARVR